jgi:MerR family transcriptional regulator, light-induced transcriptional regulator
MPAEEIHDRFLAALLAADDVDAVDAVREALGEGMDGYAVIDDVLTPALYEVGRRWELDQVSIADEHLATAIAHRALVVVYPVLVAAEPRSRERVLMAGAEGEEHVLGLRIAADVLEGSGFDVKFAGGALPVETLLQAIERHRPRIVGLSATFALDRGALREAVATLRSDAPVVGILLGGVVSKGFDEIPGVQVALHARDVLPAAERLLAELGPVATVA